MWGRVHSHTNGYRAQYMYPVKLWNLTEEYIFTLCASTGEWMRRHFDSGYKTLDKELGVSLATKYGCEWVDDPLKDHENGGKNNALRNQK